MFNEYELLDRYDAAARAGFKGVELQAPYSAPVEQIVERLERNSLKHVIINSPVADPDSGKNTIALRPDRRDLYMERTAQAGEYASALGCIGVNIGVGPLDACSKERVARDLIDVVDVTMAPVALNHMQLLPFLRILLSLSNAISGNFLICLQNSFGRQSEITIRQGLL